MIMSAWLKAGLIGGAILFILDVIGQIPVICCCMPLLMLAAYIIVGVLAASYMPVPRDSGKAAGQGALAAVVASFIGGLINLIISMVRTVVWSSTTQVGQVWTSLPPDVQYMLRDMGIEPEFFNQVNDFGSSLVGSTICGSVCCLGGILVAAALGAIGAAIYASMKSDS
jgi:amino acid transporter